MFAAEQTCGRKGFEEPTLFTAPDGFLHFTGESSPTQNTPLPPPPRPALALFRLAPRHDAQAAGGRPRTMIRSPCVRSTRPRQLRRRCQVFALHLAQPQHISEFVAAGSELRGPFRGAEPDSQRRRRCVWGRDLGAVGRLWHRNPASTQSLNPTTGRGRVEKRATHEFLDIQERELEVDTASRGHMDGCQCAEVQPQSQKRRRWR